MIKSISKLSKALNLNLKDISEKRFKDFPLLLPESYLKRIKLKDKNDPLLLQVLPSRKEQKSTKGFTKDPLNEKKFSPVPGLIHKYHGRVLLLVTNQCAINCRFCFRRYLRKNSFNLKKAISYIKNDPSINEVILSGGDPLILSPKRLKDIFGQLEKIDHLKKIRIHSRIPIVKPESTPVIPRLDRGIQVVLIVHCNHPNEINKEVIKKIKEIKKTGVAVFNQSVLLKNINDAADVLIDLSEKLFIAGIIPSYLHILDKVKGASHFYVGLSRAKKLHQKMQERLSGYLVPKLVVEIENRKKYV